MVALRIPGVITPDHKLIIELPKDAPIGPVEVVIQPSSANVSVSISSDYINPLREALRAKMAALGKLGTAHLPPSDMIVPTEEEIFEAGTLARSARPTHEIIDEERGEW